MVVAPLDLPTIEKGLRMARGVKAVLELSPDSHDLEVARASGRGKYTMAEMRSIGGQIEAHARANGSYPQNAADLDLRITDGWENPMRYECIAGPDKSCAGYGLVSAGKDGEFEHDTLDEYSYDRTSRFDCDIVFANGSFVQYPEGVRP